MIASGTFLKSRQLVHTIWSLFLHRFLHGNSWNTDMVRCFLLLCVVFFFFFLCWVFVIHGLSLAAASRGYTWSTCTGFSFRWRLLLWSAGSVVHRLHYCSLRAQKLWPTGLVPLRHVGSSQTRGWTGVPWVSRQILIQCTTREVPALCFDAHWRFGPWGHWPYTRDGRAVDYI